MSTGFWPWGLHSAVRGKAGPLPLIPKVRSSTIPETEPDGILVKFDRPMVVTCDIAAQVNVIIDGAAPIHPDHTVFNQSDLSEIGFIFGTDFTPGQVVTWAYDDSGACDLKEADPPNTEAENQTYTVNNHVALVMTADSTAATADTTQHTADEGA